MLRLNCVGQGRARNHKRIIITFNQKHVSLDSPHNTDAAEQCFFCCFGFNTAHISRMRQPWRIVKSFRKNQARWKKCFLITNYLWLNSIYHHSLTYWISYSKCNHKHLAFCFVAGKSFKSDRKYSICFVTFYHSCTIQCGFKCRLLIIELSFARVNSFR